MRFGIICKILIFNYFCLTKLNNFKYYSNYLLKQLNHIFYSMKQISLIIILFVFISACKNTNNEDSGFQIKGYIKDYPEGKVVLFKNQDNKLFAVDSVFMTRGKFKFKQIKVETPELYYIIGLYENSNDFSIKTINSDPLNTFERTRYMRSCFRSGDYEETKEQLIKIMEFDPSNFNANKLATVNDISSILFDTHNDHYEIFNVDTLSSIILLLL